MTQGPSIRRLVPADAEAFQALRLAGLLHRPEAFGSTWEEEKDLPIAKVRTRLDVRPDAGVFGAFADGALIGMVGLGRETGPKFSHKGFIWGMYVDPAAAGRGVGRALLEAALALARSQPGLRHLTLHANAANRPAISLYQSLGFVEIGREPGAMRVGNVFHDEIRMFLPIATVGLMAG